MNEKEVLQNMRGILTLIFCLVLDAYGKDLSSLNFRIDSSESEERIVGGTLAVNHSRPWMVYLYGPKSSACGGSLIEPQWVLTAAHCVDNPNEQYTAVAGTNQAYTVINNVTYLLVGEDGEARNVTKIYLNGFNNQTYQNDIALVKLDRPFTLKKNIKTIPLTNKTYNVGDMLEVTGWGYTSTAPKTYSCLLLKLELPLVSERECRKIHKTLFSSQICAGYYHQGKGICDGDSGGPLVDLNGGDALLVGVLSLGTVSCDSYSAYSSVTFYSSWIRNTVKKRKKSSKSTKPPKY